MRAAIVCAMFTAVARSQNAPPAPEPVFKFGTTVVATTGFRGQVYHIDLDSTQLPDISKLKPKGTIYTPYHLATFAICALVVWTAPQTWTFTQRLTPMRAVICLALFVVSVATMWTQTTNPFLYFQF